MPTNSPLKQARLDRGWNRTQVIIAADSHFSLASLERWEDKGCTNIREDNIAVLCRILNKSPQELGLDPIHAIIGVENAPTIQEGTPIMSEMIRRAVLSNLGSRLTGLIDLWPRRDYHYEELQAGINKAIFDHHVLVQQDSIVELSRREALQSMALVPVQLSGGVALVSSNKIQKTDTDVLLKHTAAGITAAWYLRRGRDLAFVSDLMSTYIALLQSTILSQSEAHRKASATLLSQSFMLKSKLADALQGDDQAIAYEEQALYYARLAESSTEQVIANREMAALYRNRKKYGQALPYAETAYGLAKGNKGTPKIILSFTASGLSICQACNGHVDDAKITLGEAHDLFDPTTLIPSIPYSEAILASVNASVMRYSRLWGESIKIYEQILTIPDISALGAVQERISHAKTEVNRDDVSRNMSLCIKLLTEAITGAKELNSELFTNQAHECYDMLRLAWPREDAVKTLGRDHFGL